MLENKNEILKKKVRGLGERHEKLYKFFYDYSIIMNTVPKIDDIVIEMRSPSENVVRQLISDLAEAGCLSISNGGKDVRLVISPEEAMMWCGEDAGSVNERMCLIERAVFTLCMMRDGEIPTFGDFMEPYRDSTLSGLIREQAEPVFYKFAGIFEAGNAGTAADPAPEGFRCVGEVFV